MGPAVRSIQTYRSLPDHMVVPHPPPGSPPRAAGGGLYQYDRARAVEPAAAEEDSEPRAMTRCGLRRYTVCVPLSSVSR